MGFYGENRGKWEFGRLTLSGDSFIIDLTNGTEISPMELIALHKI